VAHNIRRDLLTTPAHVSLRRSSHGARRIWRAAAGAGAGALVSLVTISCGTDKVTQPRVNGDPAAAFTHVRMNLHAINLTNAPYDTVTIAVTPYNGANNTLPLTGATVNFLSRDTVVLRVNETGLVTPQKIGVGTWIVASIRIGKVTMRDSAWVTRLATEPIITGISAAPVDPDTAIVTPYLSKDLAVVLTGDELDGLAVHYELRDTTALFLWPDYTTRTFGAITWADFTGTAYATVWGSIPGTTWVRVSTTLRGVTYVDSVQYTVRNSWSTVQISTKEVILRDGTRQILPYPETAYLTIGGVATWITKGPAVIFDDSSKARPGADFGPSAVSGNIAAWTPASFFDFRSRSFIAADTIHWHSPELNVSGRIIVFDETECQPNCEMYH
jgi:hypothetical protein